MNLIFTAMKNIGIMLLFITIGFAPFAQSDTKKEEIKLREEPSYAGGMGKMSTFISENIKYPNDAIESKTSGTVYTSLLIDEKGKIVEVEILRGVSKSLDLEAIRVIERMPNWTPGLDMEGNAVKTSVTLPIAFRMN
jgi:TonB family protein